MLFRLRLLVEEGGWGGGVGFAGTLTGKGSRTPVRCWEGAKSDTVQINRTVVAWNA
jgi:hypothetical protein